MVSQFVATRSDFTYFFKSIGKAQFFKIFYLNAKFISGTTMPGSMDQFNQSNKELGFLFFVRLIGTIYFKKHLPSFISLYGHETPEQLYNSTSTSLAPKERHKDWLQKICGVVSERILSEDERMPSIGITGCVRHISVLYGVTFV